MDAKTPVEKVSTGISTQHLSWPVCLSKRLPLVVLVLLALLSGSVGWGQIVTASLNGNVKDASGAALPNASVTATDTSTNVSANTTTDASGEFVFPQLSPGGPYTIRIGAAGFKIEVRSGIHLDVNQHAEVPIVLQVGSESQEVQVYADAAQVDATSAAIGQVIENRSIEDLPLNQRNVYQLVFLAPGVTGNVNANYNSLNISIDGGRPGSTDILLDGIPASPPLIVPIGGLAAFPSVDAVQEFKVMNNQYSAQFGRSGSGIINIVLKAGTNQWHGTAYEFARNSVLDANTFFANRNGKPLLPFSRNQFGGSLSGPVVVPKLYNGKDKTFFLFSYEGLRQGQTSDNYFSVPTALERTGDFSQTHTASGQPVVIYDPSTTVKSGSSYTRSPFPGNRIPASQIDAVAAKIINYYPLPNTTGINGTDVNDFFASGVTKTSIDTYDSRADEVFNDRNRMFVRYSRRGLTQPPLLLFPQASQIAEGGYNQPQVSNSAAIDYTRTQSQNFVLDIRYGFSRTAINFVPVSAGFNPSAKLGFPGYIAANADHLLFPGIAPANYYTLGDAGQGSTRHGGFEIHLLGIDATKVLGHHVVRFGGDGRLLRANDLESGNSTGGFSFTNGITQGPNPNAATATGGNSIASLLLGVGSGSMIINSKNAATESKYYGLYIQDDWQALPKLSLNLGLRYDLDIPRTERYNRMETFNPAVPSPLGPHAGLSGLYGGVLFTGVNGTSRRQFSPRYLDFDPRVGFSYAFNPNTTIRGGYGIYYMASLRAAGVTIGSEGFSNVTTYNGSPNGLTPSVYLSNPFPNGLNLPVGATQGLLTGVGTAFNTPLTGDNKVGYIQSWDLDIQRQLPSNILVEAAYVGTHGVHLNKGGEGNYNLNQLSPATLAQGTTLQQSVPNPFYGLISNGPESGRTIARSFLESPFPQFVSLGLLYPIGGYEHYNAFQFKLEKHVSHGLTALVAFTDQKQIDDYSGVSNVGHIAGGIQNIYNDRGERSLSSNNIGRSLVVSAVYVLPFGRGQNFGAHWNRGVDALLGGWQINGIATEQNGFPLSPTTQNTSNSGSNVLRPNLTGANLAEPGSPVSKLANYINPAAFSQPAPFTFGNAPRTFANVRGPGTHNIDASLFKNYSLERGLDLQIRAEFFNVLNQVVFASPNMTLSSGQFGVISGQANQPRQIQLAAKIVF